VTSEESGETPRSVVITGASRGLGLACAVHLYRRGWHVVAAMRSPQAGMERLRAATGATEDDPRLTAVALDLDDEASIVSAARAVVAAVGAPHALVHNAGVASVGCTEEMPLEAWEQVFRTNLFGPVRLTRELLPRMRAAGRGRIIILSSQGGLRGMPSTAAYSGVKAAVERWAESLSQEIASFGLGVTVLVPGAFATDILEKTHTYADMEGPYGRHHAALEASGRRMIRLARPPERFAPALERALNERTPFARHPVGPDARLMLYASSLLPIRAFQQAVRLVMRLPRPNTRPVASL
jgi:NAD(P)-dependent dehydrogenase (short-subunit alcohol dehydrogenase family)